MIEDYEQFILHDKERKNDLTCEVNFRPEDPDLNRCKIIRITLGDKKAYLTKEELNSFLFIIGEPNEQRKMIPMTITKVRHYQTNVKIMAKKDIRKGEIIFAPVMITLPAVSEEIISDVVSKQVKGNNYDLNNLLKDFKGKTQTREPEVKTTYINETKQGIKKDD